MLRHQNAVYMCFMSGDIHKYWFRASLSDILQHQRVPSQNPNLSIFPEFSQLRTFSMWQVKCPPFWKYQVCFCKTFFLSLPKITLSSLDYKGYHVHHLPWGDASDSYALVDLYEFANKRPRSDRGGDKRPLCFYYYNRVQEHSVCSHFSP